MTRATLTIGAAAVALLALPAGAGAGAQNYGAPYAGSETTRPDGPPVAAGVRLPPVFLGDGYVVRDEAAWNLPPAAPGLQWVRYYDDAVLVGRDGVVREVRSGMNWDGQGGYASSLGYRGLDRNEYAGFPGNEAAGRDGYDPRCFDPRAGRNDGATVAGAIGGAVVGGVAGNIIAGRGDRTAGTLIGGGLGAIAGGVAGSELGRDRSPIGPCPTDGNAYAGSYDDSYAGRSVYDEPEPYEEYEDEPVYAGPDGRYGTPPPYAGRPVRVERRVTTTRPRYGYATSPVRVIGYAPGGGTTTTVVVGGSSTTTTTTITDESEVYAHPARRARRATVHRPRARHRTPRCTCK